MTNLNSADGRLQLCGTLADLATAAKGELAERYGTCSMPVAGHAYHNYDHGRDVSAAAGRIASLLHETRRTSWETAVLALYAGWCHDLEQGHGHERRSADRAAAMMRRHGLPEEHIATVQTMIAATQVTGVDGGRLLQAADPTDLRQALLADADLSSLGATGGVHRSMLLDLEQQHLAGQLTLGARTDDVRIEPDRHVTVAYLTNQAHLFAEHRFLLDETRRLYPHQQLNADLLTKLLERYTADRISYTDMLTAAKRHATTTQRRPSGVSIIGGYPYAAGMTSHHGGDRPVSTHEVEFAHPQGFSGHEFEYDSSTDLFACVRCGRYEVSVRDRTTGEISPCTGGGQ